MFTKKFSDVADVYFFNCELQIRVKTFKNQKKEKKEKKSLLVTFIA